MGKAHANGKLCRAETNIESAAGSIEAEVEARRDATRRAVFAFHPLSPVRDRLLHVEILSGAARLLHLSAATVLLRGGESATLPRDARSWRRSLGRDERATTATDRGRDWKTWPSANCSLLHSGMKIELGSPETAEPIFPGCGRATGGTGGGAFAAPTLVSGIGFPEENVLHIR